ncbi:MAG: hypothetical protein GX548_12375 [Lentisphaerae bacterium]|nr:hypothetical protein [Lentisphaerota bacterium]
MTDEAPMVDDVVLVSAPSALSSRHLLFSLKYGVPEGVQARLQEGADPNARDESGIPALVCAAREGYLTSVKRLVEAGASLDVWDARGRTALDYATRENQEAIMAYLLAEGATPSRESLPPRGLIRGNVLDDDGEALSGVLLNMRDVVVRDPPGEPMQTRTRFEGRFEFTMLAPGTYDLELADFPGESVRVEIACRTSVVDGLEFRIRRTTAMNQRLLAGNYPLDAGQIQRLVGAGADVNVRSANEETPLLRAAGKANLHILQALLEAGADPCATDATGETPLLKAAQALSWAQAPVMPRLKFLLEAGADVNAEDQQGRSVLWHAYRLERDDMIDLFREYGAVEPRAPFPPRGILRGVVLDEKDRAVPSATVYYSRISEIGKPPFGSYRHERVHVDEHGVFELRRLEAGVYRMRVANPADPPQEVAVETPVSRITNLVFRSSPRLETGQEMIRAAMTGGVEMVKACLKDGAAVDTMDWLIQMTALQVAAGKENAELVRLLLEAGADPDPPTETRRPALVLAANRGLLENVRLLVEAGADLEATDFQGRTALDEAIRQEHEEVADYLSQAGARPSSMKPRPKGIIRGRVLDEDGEPLRPVPGLSLTKKDNRSSSLLGHFHRRAHAQFEWDGLEPGTYLLGLRGTNTPDIAVTLESRTSIVERIELQTTRAAERDQDLIEAAHSANLDRVRELITAGASLWVRNRNGAMALSSAIDRNRLDVARVLVEAGADINAVDSDGRTLLMKAAYDWKPEMVQFLLELGADPHVRTLAGGTALTCATRRVRSWRRAEGGETPDRVDHRGGWILRNGCPKCVRLLLDAGADIEVTDPDGLTPLINVTLSGRMDLVRMLLEAGAEVDSVDKSGRTALSHARRHRRHEIADLLLEHGAQEPKELPSR